LKRRDLLQDDSPGVEVQLEPPKSLIKVPPFRRLPARTAELIVWQNAISFSGNSYPTTNDLQAGRWPEGLLAPEGVSDVALTDGRTMAYSA
jgi:hypothetical protein